MRVLGLETSGIVCGVALLVLPRGRPRDAATLAGVLGAGKLIAHDQASEFSRHSEALWRLLGRVLRQGRCRLADLDAIAVSLGPGSFTGLRVGLAAAKVFARFGRIPLIGVPTLEAQAAQAALRGGPGKYVATIDANRGEVYAGVFTGGGVSPLRMVRAPRVRDPLEVARGLPAGARLVAAVPRAAAVAGMGAVRFFRGERSDPDRLVPIYVRRPAAVEKLALRKKSRSRR